MRAASSVASANFVAGRHQHAVGTVTAEVRERTHRRRVITKDDVRAVHGPSLVQLCPTGSRPRDLQRVGADSRHRHALWTAGHCRDVLSTPVSEPGMEQSSLIVVTYRWYG